MEDMNEVMIKQFIVEWSPAIIPVIFLIAYAIYSKRSQK